MKSNLLLTGLPGVGKTTVIQRAASRFEPRFLAGFYTLEIRTDAGRQGFAIRTFDGDEAILAHRDFKTGPAVGRYRVDLAAIEKVIVPSLRPKGRDTKLIIIDEIGKMECLSPAFCQAVLAALDGTLDVLGTIPRHTGGFIQQVKDRKDVLIFEVTRSNRGLLPEDILATLTGGFISPD